MALRKPSAIVTALAVFLFAFLLVTSRMRAQDAAAKSRLSVHWAELTAADFREAIHHSQGTCLLPFGALENPGPHLPLSTPLPIGRYATLHTSSHETAVIFP